MKNQVSLNTSEAQYLLHQDRPSQVEVPSHIKRDRILTLLGGVCVHLVLGTFYLWGAIALYVASYLRSIDNSVTISQLMNVPPLTIIGMNIGQAFGVPLAERFGTKIVIFSSLTTIALAVGASSQATSYGLFVGLYGILNGITTGIAYMVPLVAGWKYFPNNKGLVSGITVGAFGFGSFIFNFVATEIVNPNNLSPTDIASDAKYFTSEVYDNVPKMFVILSLCYMTLGVLGTILVRVPNKEDEEKIKAVNTNQNQSITSNEEVCDSIKEGVFSTTFLILFLIGSCGATFGLFIANNYKVYGLTKISEDHFITVVGSIGAVSNGGTRAVWALFFDKYGFKKVFFFLIVIQIVLNFTIDLISSTGALYLIWVSLILGCEGGYFSLLPAACAKIFGLKFGPRIYGIMFWCFAVATWASLGLTKLALNVIGWTNAFLIAGGISTAALVLNFFVKETFTKKNESMLKI